MKTLMTIIINNINAAKLITLLAATTIVQAYEITFPVGGSGDYWTSCKVNHLKWTTNMTESDIFSVAILNTNSSIVNGNYQIANSLPSTNGTAMLHINCLPPADGYYLAFVNSSKYSLNNPQVYYTSPTFSIQPNTSTVLEGTSAKYGPLATTPTSGQTTATTTANGTTADGQAANPVSGTALDESKTNGKNGAAIGIAPPSTAAAIFLALLLPLVGIGSCQYLLF